VLHRYDVLLVADEVVCGFGRLGSWFGSEVYRLRPDVITVAKGITSAYVPLSGCLISERVWAAIADASPMTAIGHGYTYSAHPVAAAAALANLDLLESERLVAQAGDRGERLQSLLHDAFDGHPIVGEVRGRGLLGAVEFVASREPLRAFEPSRGIGARIAARCLGHGLITRALPASDTIAFSPPFVVGDDELVEMVRRARAAVDDVAAELDRE
jgi:L-2,4-diaminobutyrate transaminase